METPAHLEKMGRELKCPICLSLLSSAVSLNCNHVFCNSCIVQSMKSASNCPVCKIPYRRREIRPAPHMDNLVGIYKSMEVASGINLFVTQNASTRSSDGKQQAEDDCSHDDQDIPEICQDKAEKRRTLRGKGSRKTNSNMKSSGPISVKHPAKKRVQVPQCPLSESPTHPKQLVGELTDERSKQSSTTVKDNVLNEKGEVVLSPFFWLRDKDIENLSQHTDGDELTAIPSPNVPTFSDIKDSDDENCTRLTPPGEAHGKSPNVADLFDSEMVKCTQRACSPELCSSPKMQVADDYEIDRIPVNELNEISQIKKFDEHSAKGARSRNSSQSSGNMHSLPDLPPAGNDSNHHVDGHESNKRGRQARNKMKRKCGTIHADQGSDAGADSKGYEVFHEEQVCTNNGGSLVRTCKRSKKEHLSVVATKPTSESDHALSTGAKSRNQRDEKGLTELPTSGNKDSSDEPASMKAEKICKETDSKNHMHRPVRSRKEKMVSMTNKMLGEVLEMKKQAKKDTKTKLSSINLPTDDNKKASEFRNNSRKLSGEAKTCNREFESNKKAKVSSDDNPRDDTLAKIRDGHGDVNENGNLPTEKIRGNSDVISDQSPALKLPSLTNNAVLQRCEAIRSKIRCAFCHSSEDSEAFGEIVHYYNGKPVAPDQIGGLEVIHAHRTCTEWAPNVYFEDDIAINLDAELTRSRRIKCSCCEIKGAALGCYERSCRRSFHVTCAKLMPECRWDTDNFVMLCPLHASSELPNESSKSQARRKKSNPRKQSNAEHHKVAVKQVSNTAQDQSFCGSSKKLVLCCSSLTNAERESVSGFERLSGLTVLKDWDSSVTHVIASTDENGASRRTLKVLMGILEGKWILSVEWINACMEAMKLVDEEPYEISVDIYGIKDGPRLGRLRRLNKQPKLFEGFKFYFMGDFIPSYKKYLQDLVIAAGGTVLHRKPAPEGQKLLSASSSKCQTLVIYSLDQRHPIKKGRIENRGQSDAKALASSTGTKAASNSWVLNSIAACQLQSLSE